MKCDCYEPCIPHTELTDEEQRKFSNLFVAILSVLLIAALLFGKATDQYAGAVWSAFMIWMPACLVGAAVYDKLRAAKTAA